MSEEATNTRDEKAFPPPPELAAHANVTAADREAAAADPEAFWAAQADRISWGDKPTQTLDWSNAPFATWYADGTLNAAYNCADRHVENGNGDKVAYYFEGEPGDTRTITYAELTESVCRAANALESLGVKAGDRVAVYMPMIPEAVVAMLACVRIGAIHTVIFGGFSAEAIATRVQDCGVTVVITADGGYRRGAAAALKPAVDEALTHCPEVRSTIVVRRTGQDTPMTEGRDHWWHELVDEQPSTHEYQLFPAEHPLYVMYTSGSTGKPKGILHTTGGYLVGTSYTHWGIFDLKDDDICWTAADIGWVTGHSYLVYGPLANGATQVMYEGTPDTPHKGRWWEIVDKYRVTVLYCAPTAIRTFMKWGPAVPAEFELSSLRILGSVGEPINPEAWLWYREHIGHNRTPVVDTWWQTETGMHMMSPLPGVDETKPGAAMYAVPGVSVDVVNEDGQPVENGESGLLVVTKPWPAMLRTLWGDDQRYIDTYWARYAGIYFAGDGAKKDEDGHFWVMGRVDDVMNVSGHRMSTAEIESALVSHDAVAEAAVVGATDETTGQAIVAFVILRGGHEKDDDIVNTLRNHVAHEISPIAKPRQVLVVDELPKTRSGKIMRRLLRDMAEGRELGDVTTLTDSSVMQTIQKDLASGS
ncbi:acetate--CoA ligase [Enemella sp. A6]|uniref:acetate--CoA ligase n=1 Tax=Enemella sp. A6 TaxID=3440152 RepID=UPI003EB90555